MNDLEKEILKLIEKYYKKKYIGGIKVTRLLSGGYKLSLDLGNPDKAGIEIAADYTDAKDFLKFIEKELISRRLIKVQFFKGYRIYDEERRTNC